MISFSSCVASLHKYLPTSVNEATNALISMVVPMEGFLAVSKHFPEEYQALKEKKYLLGKRGLCGKPLEDIREVINKYIPVQDQWDEMLSESEEFLIYIEPMGLCMGWDDFNEDLEDPSSNLSVYAGPDMLVQGLAHDIDTQSWMNLINYFEWPIEPPQMPSFRWFFWCQEIYDALASAGLSELVPVWQLNCWDTGTVFLDVNSYDEAFYLETHFGMDRISWLIEQKQLADAHLEKYTIGQKMIMQDPGLIQRQVDIFLENLHERKPDSD